MDIFGEFSLLWNSCCRFATPTIYFTSYVSVHIHSGKCRKQSSISLLAGVNFSNQELQKHLPLDLNTILILSYVYLVYYFSVRMSKMGRTLFNDLLKTVFNYFRLNSWIKKIFCCWCKRFNNTTCWSTCTYERVSFAEKLLYCWFCAFSLVVCRKKHIFTARWWDSRIYFSVIKRLVSLLSATAREMVDSAAARKQAANTSDFLEKKMANDQTVRLCSQKFWILFIFSQNLVLHR